MEVTYFTKKIRSPMFNQRNRVETDIQDMYDKVLSELMAKGKDVSSAEVRDRLKSYLAVIYWSLNAHLLFYLGYPQPNEPTATNGKLEKLCRYCVPDVERNRLPGLESVIDPASVLLELFSEMLYGPTDAVRRGSAEHAGKVLDMARWFFGRLSKQNMFRPTCLAKTSHNDMSFLGASMAVGHFLQPICLHNRITNLKGSLGLAIINYCPLNIPDEWKIEAFTKSHGGGYASSPNKLPCQNCNMMFLGDRSGSGGPTILGLCAEYCAVNQLLPDEQTLKQTLEQSDMPEVSKLIRNHEQCRLLFNNYRDTSNECLGLDPTNTRGIVIKYWEIIYKLHIFLLAPECNRYF